MNLPLAAAILHGTCVCVHGKGVLITGPSGAGKSSLGLRLIAMGAGLVADDRTEITVENGGVFASCPAAISGLIEARGVGVLRLPVVAQVKVALVVDLGQIETDRLPPRRHVSIAGVQIEVVHGPISDHFSAAVLCYLNGQRQD